MVIYYNNLSLKLMDVIREKDSYVASWSCTANWQSSLSQQPPLHSSYRTFLLHKLNLLNLSLKMSFPMCSVLTLLSWHQCQNCEGNSPLFSNSAYYCSIVLLVAMTLSINITKLAALLHNTVLSLSVQKNCTICTSLRGSNLSLIYKERF